MCVFLGLLGCQGSYLGDSIADEFSQRVLEKTFQLPVRTVLYPDSIPTLNDDLLFVGRYKSPFFGTLEAKSHARLSQSDQSQPLSEVIDYDSIVFKLVLDYTYGERGPFRLKVHPLRRALATNVSYVAQTEVTYDANVTILDRTLSKAELRSDTLLLRADNSWAAQFANKVSDAYLLTYPGFSFTFGEENSTILGFSVQHSSMILYYKDPQEASEALQQRFTFSSLRYNSYKTERTGSLLKDLEQGAYTLLPDFAYSQAASGVFCAIDLSEVRAFYEKQGGFTTHTAQLNIGALAESADPNIERIPPRTLRLSKPFPAPFEAKNNVKSIVTRNISNDSGFTGTQDRYFHAQTQEPPYTTRGNVAIGLQEALLDSLESRYWLLSALDFSGFEPILLPGPHVELKLYYIPPE